MELPIILVDEVLLSPDIITEKFFCDIEKCKGLCCVEGDAGAPLTLEEIDFIEDSLENVWELIPKESRKVIENQGVAYSDIDGELVTSIVGKKDCVFACKENGCYQCSLEILFCRKKTSFRKPMSCFLYPIREKKLINSQIALNYHHWDVCKAARIKGKELNMPLYKFLKRPLILRFGIKWYKELEKTVIELRKAGYIE